MSGLIRRHLLVAGRVQGVGYRAACARMAARLGLAGSVRNLEDGRVEIFAVGERHAVEQLIVWCRQGPAGAWVGDLTVTEEPMTDENLGSVGFQILL